MDRAYITKEQAVGILPDGDYVHTFLNPGFGLVGADWSREDILQKITESDVLELTGEHAKGMGHGLVAYNKTAKFQSDLLFIETDKEKLEILEKSLVSEAEKKEAQE